MIYPLLLLLLLAQPVRWASTLPALLKVRPGRIPAGSEGRDLSAAQGSCEAFQVVVDSPAQSVRAIPEGLRGPGRPLMPRIYREEWLEVREGTNGQEETGLWPDPLIPLADAYANEARTALPVDSTSKRPLVLYVEVCVPPNQAPGKYQGQLSLTAVDKPELKFPISVEVQPFELPASSSLPNSFGISLYSVARGHGLGPESTEAMALLRAYATALLAHRITPHGLSMHPPQVAIRGEQMEVDFSGYDREMAPFLEGKVLPSGARFTTAEIRENPKALASGHAVDYYRAFSDHFHRRWKALLFYYAKDEPKPQDFPLVAEQARRVHQAGGIPVLLTVPYSDQWAGIADILCPILNCFFARPGPQTCANVHTAEDLRKRLSSRSRIWWYQSCSAHGCTRAPDPATRRAYSGWASYMVDHPAPLNRAMGSLAFLQGVDGELYFDTVWAYHDRDPWKDLFAFGGNGDGTLFYPGTPSRVGGQRHIPIESLRLKYIRDGLQDYEYLSLLRAAGDESFAQQSALKLTRSGFEISADPEVWERVRLEMISRLKLLSEKRPKR